MRSLLLLGLALVACAPNSPEPLTERGSSALRPGAISGETALLSLVLSPDGQARFDAAQRRPIAYSAPKTGTHHGATTDYVVEVQKEGHATVRVPVSLGRPHDALAEARSAWAGGGTILRAPCFGPGTHYALLAAAQVSGRPLAQIEVQE